MKVDFYLDVISPYTYLAWKVLVLYRPIWQLEVTLKPIFLGALMNNTGNVPPATIPGKAKFMHSDLSRSAKWMKIESKFKHMPSNFFVALPKLTLKINRILAAFAKNPEIQWKLVDSAFSLIWESPEYRNAANEFVETQDLIKHIFRLAAVPYPADLEALVTAGRDLVTQNTKEALELDAFGAPIFRFPEAKDTKIFFGSDRWEQMAFLLGKPWLGVCPSSRL